MRGKRALAATPLLALRLFACGWLCHAQDAGQRRATLQTLSSEIHTTLGNLRRQSEDLTMQLVQARNDLETSSRQVGELQTELNGLNTSLRNTSEKLGEYSMRLSAYEAELRRRAKIITAAAIMLAMFILVRGALIVLKVKFKFELPYWINLLL